MSTRDDLDVGAEFAVASGKREFPAQQGKSVVVANPAATLVAPFPIKRRMLTSDKSWDRAIPWSIVLDVEGSGADHCADTPGAIAEVRWGTGGVRHVAYVDWRKGQRFVVVGASVELDLWLLNPTDWGVAAANLAGWPVVFRASMTPNAVPQVSANCGPTLTVAIAGPLNPAVGSAVVTIPPFARRLRFSYYRADASAAAGYIIWNQGTPLAVGVQCRLDRYAAGGGSGLMEWDQGLTIPSDACLVRFQPDGVAPGAVADAMRFTFELSL